MTGAEVLDVARDGIWVLIIVSAPMMIVGLVVGVVIALFQAIDADEDAPDQRDNERWHQQSPFAWQEAVGFTGDVPVDWKVRSGGDGHEA